MQFLQSIILAGTALATLASAAPSAGLHHQHAHAHARRGNAGTLTITNKCQQPLFLNQGWDAPGPMPTSTQIPLSGVGKTYKIGDNAQSGYQNNIAQLEFTNNDDVQTAGAPTGTLQYDLSLIKGNPLLAGGQTMYTRNAAETYLSNPGMNCVEKVQCAPNAQSCPGVYNDISDNPSSHLTRTSNTDVNIEWVLCDGTSP